MENAKTEIYGKVWLYNHMTDTAINNGYGTPMMVYLSVIPPLDASRREEKQ